MVTKEVPCLKSLFFLSYHHIKIQSKFKFRPIIEQYFDILIDFLRADMTREKKPFNKALC